MNMKMKVTVCQLHDDPAAFERDWQQLVAHVRHETSDLVLLPEMPFYPWFAGSRTYDPGKWAAAVEAHDAWERRLAELAPGVVIGTRPIDFGNERYNEGFVWERSTGIRGAHAKAYLPNEEGVWEASWYHAATPEFIPVQVREARIGFLICTELWDMEQARLYGLERVHLLVTPRVTAAATLDKWLAGGRVAAILAGAFGLSSNRSGKSGLFGGQGWIVDPDGAVLALTSADRPFATATIDLLDARKAKTTYPRYALTRKSPAA
jgi:N-carbamoylputrescine amidase